MKVNVVSEVGGHYFLLLKCRLTHDLPLRCCATGAYVYDTPVIQGVRAEHPRDNEVDAGPARPPEGGLREGAHALRQRQPRQGEKKQGKNS